MPKVRIQFVIPGNVDIDVTDEQYEILSEDDDYCENLNTKYDLANELLNKLLEEDYSFDFTIEDMYAQDIIDLEKENLYNDLYNSSQQDSETWM